jgi:hypothetical protein
MQLVRHTFAQDPTTDEFFVKVFNRTVENFVEKARREIRIPRWA